MFKQKGFTLIIAATIMPKGERYIFGWLHACHIIICFLFVDNSLGEFMNGNEACVEDNFRLNCFGEIPTVIYGKIAAVSVRQFMQDKLDASAFDDTSWNQVKSLTIEVKENINLDRIYNGTFQSLDSLTELTFRCAKLQTLYVGTFKGLGNLRLMNLSGNAWLQGDSLIKALPQIQSIDTLILDDVGSVFSRVVHVGQVFIDILRQKGIKRLSLSNTNLYFETISFLQEALSIKDLNLSNSQIFQPQLDQGITLHHMFSNLRVLDISGLNNKFLMGRGSSLQFDCNVSNNVYIKHLLSLEKIYFNNVNMLGYAISGFVMNASLCQCNLKVLQWRSFNIKVLNVTIYWPNDSPLIDIDMSRNAMEHFSIKGYITISRLKLSHNQLYRMQNNPDFALLLDSMPFLEDVHLDHNGLTYIPKDIFRRNSRLKYIRMQGNILKRFYTDISHLHSLRHLDLRQNQIKFIEPLYLDMFDNLHNLQASMNITQVFEIDIRNNEIECSCLNFKFVEWIVSKKHNTPGTLYDIACYFAGRRAEMIHQGTLRSVDFLCRRTLVIVVSSVAGLVCISIAFGAICLFIRQKKKTHLKTFTDRFKTRKTKEKFLALISHSKNDDKVVYEYIRPNLEQSMRNVLQVDFDLLCLGDIHFRPGMAIVDEIYKSVSESCVAMFVISRAFCESGWCKCELKEAYGQSKPIILMFLEEVDEDNMTPLMQNIFRKYTRVKLTQCNEEGVIEVSQSWDSISQSIIHLAVDQCRTRICF